MHFSEILTLIQNNIFSGIFAATIGVAATVGYNFWAERRRLKIDCFRQLMRNGAGNPDFQKAFNEVPVIFAGRTRVLAAHLEALDTSTETGTFTGGDHMMKLIKVIAADLGFRGIADRQLAARFGGPAKG